MFAFDEASKREPAVADGDEPDQEGAQMSVEMAMSVLKKARKS